MCNEFTYVYLERLNETLNFLQNLPIANSKDKTDNETPCNTNNDTAEESVVSEKPEEPAVEKEPKPPIIEEKPEETTMGEKLEESLVEETIEEPTVEEKPEKQVTEEAPEEPTREETPNELSFEEKPALEEDKLKKVTLLEKVRVNHCHKVYPSY